MQLASSLNRRDLRDPWPGLSAALRRGGGRRRDRCRQHLAPRETAWVLDGRNVHTDGTRFLGRQPLLTHALHPRSTRSTTAGQLHTLGVKQNKPLPRQALTKHTHIWAYPGLLSESEGAQPDGQTLCVSRLPFPGFRRSSARTHGTHPHTLMST